MAHVTWITLTRDYEIVDVEGDLAHLTAHRVGQNLWEAFPDGIEAFRDSYEQAWKVGYDNRSVVWRGCVVQTYATVCNDQLNVCYHVFTLEGLRDAITQLDASLALQGSAASSPSDPQALPAPRPSSRRRGFRLLRGGAMLLTL